MEKKFAYPMFIILLLSLCLFNQFLNAEQISDNLSTGDQRYPALASSFSSLYFVMAWCDIQTEGCDIRVQLFDPEGDLVGNPITVNDVLLQSQTYVDVAMAEFGKFVVVWTDYENSRIYAQRFSSSGVRIGDVIDVVHHAAIPAVAMAADGSFLIVHADEGFSNIVGHLYDPDGQKVDVDIDISSGGDTGYPDIDVSSDGFYVFVWQQGLDELRIKSSCFDAKTKLIGNTILVRDHASVFGRRANSPTIAVAEDRSSVIAWADNALTGDFGIIGKRYDHKQNQIGDIFTIHENGIDPAIAMNDEGEFIVDWSFPKGTHSDIYARRFHHNATPNGVSYRVNDESGETYQGRPAVTWNRGTWGQDAILHVFEDRLPPDQEIVVTIELEYFSQKTLHVPNDYATVQGAIDAANPGDIIQVAPGTYDISTAIVNDRVNHLQLLGSRKEDGSDASIINAAVNPGSYHAIYFKNVSGCLISGFEIKNAQTGIMLDYCMDCEVTRSYLHHHDQATSFHGTGILISHGQQIKISYCVADSNEFHGIDLNNSQFISILNNTVIRTMQYDGIMVAENTDHIVIKNNIIAWNKQEGIEISASPADFVHDYNCFWKNGGSGNIQGQPIGPHSMDADPMLADIDHQNYFLQPGSPCLGSGEGGVNIGAMGLIITGISDTKVRIPTDYMLSQNFPNPFNPTTHIYYRLAHDGDVALNIFDMTGRNVKVLLNETQSAGFYAIQWDGRDDHGIAVASGIYLYRIRAGNYICTKRLALTK